MDELILYPAAVRGSIAAPPSKSAAHRALICAALSKQDARVFPVSASDDMEATLQVLGAMGAKYSREGEHIVFRAHGWEQAPQTPLDCAESGSTLRFLLPVAAALGIKASITGRGRLPARPLDALTSQLSRHGVTFSAPTLPLTLGGQLSGGCFTLPGDVSSQFISGLLLALPLLPEGGEVAVHGALQSEGYVDLTLSALADSGVKVEKTARGWKVPGAQRYRDGDYFVEGDYSNAAFWLCAGALACPAGEELAVTGLAEGSVQGDRAVTSLLEMMGASLRRDHDKITVKKSCLRGCRIDAGPVPDLVPALAAAAAFAEGKTEFYNAARLRIKESDRIASTASLVRALGGQAMEYADRLVVIGTGAPLPGGMVDSFGDHRIVMAAAVAAAACSGPVTIRGWRAVDKSYPNFFSDYEIIRGE